MLPKLLIFIVFLAVATSVPVEQNQKITPKYLLPDSVVEAINYQIHLEVDHATFNETHTFKGTTIINFINKQSSNEIQLHGNELTISSIKLEKKEENSSPLLATPTSALDSETDILTLTTTDTLEENAEYLLTFEYTAKFRTNEMYGFYKSSYVDADKNVRILGSTQFQPTHARKVFPCFDEPKYKATFDVKITYPIEYSAIGNTVGETIEDDVSQTKTTTFNTTPKMSTYLIAFVISDFTCTDSEIEPNVPHIVCSRDDAKDFRNVALEVGPMLVRTMENLTGVKYTRSGLTKMHEVAIPDFSAGAMENWGLLTYRETALLWDPNHSSNSYKQGVENVVAHEIAHMWFGNLVTTHWWSDTFLNEGFARFFQYFATAEVRTESQLDKQFVIDQIHSVFATDAQPTATALSSEAYSPTEISGKFGTISYNKGAAIIRMIQHVLGTDNFYSGINKYLSANEFTNTVPEDLWSQLQPSTNGLLPTGVTLSQVVENWVTKPGFPVLTVSANGNNITISQKRFLASGEPQASEKWYVPITYAKTKSEFETTSTKNWLLPDEDLTIENILSETVDWIVLNNLQTGYYRINYDETLLSKIELALKSDKFEDIHELNRAQLVDDIYNLANIEIYSYKQVLDFLKYLENERSYYPWSAAIRAFSNMLQRTSDQKIIDELSNRIQTLISPLYTDFSFDTPNDSDQIYTLNRVQAVTWACKVGHQECLNKAEAAFKSYQSSKIKPDKNLRGVIYCNGLRHSKDIKTDWDFLWEEYGATDLATEKVTILSGLGCAKDSTILTEYLLKSINADSGIKQQDALSVFSAVYSQNAEGVDIALDFLINHYQAISTYYGSMNSLINLISGLAARFTHQDQITKLENFVNEATDLTESLKLSAQSAIANAKINLQWTQKFEKELSTYFNIGNTAGTIKVGLTTIVTSVLVLLYQLVY